MTYMIIDSRESRSQVHRYLMADPTLEVTVRELSAGDYLPHENFGVERKEATDFVLSIMDRRIFSQVLRLKAEFAQVLFILEGDPYTTRSGISAEAIRGALSYLMTIEGVSLMMVRNAQETASLLSTMARHLQNGLGYEVPLRVNKPKDLQDLARYLVEGLPGVGASSAKILLSHFGSPAQVFSASVAQLMAVPGFGKKTAERIFEALHTKM